jgi:Leucine Rich repeat
VSQQESEAIEERYREQDYDWDSEVVEVDEYNYGEACDIEGMLRDKCQVIKKIDMMNIAYSFSKIETALKDTRWLIELRLSSCNIISQECLSLARSPVLSQIRSLDLSCNAIKLPGLLHLLDAENSKLKNLRRLDLYYCNIAGIQLD